MPEETYEEPTMNGGRETVYPRWMKVVLDGEHAGEINLLITDVVMPELNGRELAEQLRSFYPDLKVLFMSGYTANVIAHRGVLEEGVYFMPKPFSREELASKVRETLDSADV